MEPNNQSADDERQEWWAKFAERLAQAIDEIEKGATGTRRGGRVRARGGAKHDRLCTHLDAAVSYITSVKAASLRTDLRWMFARSDERRQLAPPRAPIPHPFSLEPRS